MKHLRIPRWCAPFTGVLVGGYCGLRAGLKAQIPLVWFVSGGAVIGGVAGLLIVLLEPRVSGGDDPNLPAHLQRIPLENPSGVVGRFLALAGLLLCWFPILGFVLNLAGYLVNRKTGDWAKRASLVGLVLGAIISIVFAILLALDLIS